MILFPATWLNYEGLCIALVLSIIASIMNKTIRNVLSLAVSVLSLIYFLASIFYIWHIISLQTNLIVEMTSRIIRLEGQKNTLIVQNIPYTAISMYTFVDRTKNHPPLYVPVYFRHKDADELVEKLRLAQYNKTK